MKIDRILEQNDLVLTEAAIIESLRRLDDITLHPRLENAPLIYDTEGRRQLSRLYNSYISVALQADVPILLFAPTWRTNRQRVEEANFDEDVNAHAVRFLKEMCSRYGPWSANIGIGGLIGCKNDCYQPEQALAMEEAMAFHEWQVDRLVDANPDFLLAATLPALVEAKGMARLMARTDTPFILSFVINRQGMLLDGNSLEKAIAEIDATCERPPLGFMCNCCYPSFLNPHRQPKTVMQRLVGYQANASSMDPRKLDGSDHLHADDLEDWGQQMVALHQKHHLTILGGCCGTGIEHLSYIVEKILTDNPSS